MRARINRFEATTTRNYNHSNRATWSSWLDNLMRSKTDWAVKNFGNNLPG